MPARTLTKTRSISNFSSAKPREVVLRVRVSSQDQEEAGFSIPAQLRLLREYAVGQGLVIVEEFVDAETSKTGDGNGFTRMGI
jgi:site-specific DNA recombinase